jgi:hypothetical protein
MEIERETLERSYIAEMKPARVVAAELGVSLYAIYALLRKHGIPVRRPGGKRDGITREKRASLLNDKPDRFCKSLRLDGTRCGNWHMRGLPYCRIHLWVSESEAKNGTYA